MEELPELESLDRAHDWIKTAATLQGMMIEQSPAFLCARAN
jgi:hypothetical protein